MPSFTKRLQTVLSDLESANSGNRATLAAELRTLSALIQNEVVTGLQTAAAVMEDTKHPVAGAAACARGRVYPMLNHLVGRHTTHTGYTFSYSDPSTYSIAAASDEVGQTPAQINATVAALIAAQP